MTEWMSYVQITDVLMSILANYCLYNGKLFPNVQECTDRRTKVVGFIV